MVKALAEGKEGLTKGRKELDFFGGKKINPEVKIWPKFGLIRKN